MTGVIEEDEGLLSTTVPIVSDRLSQIADGLAEGFEVGIFDLYDIHAACTQSLYSLAYVSGIIFDLVNVLEAFISWIITAQHVVVPIFDYYPLVMVGSEVFACFYHLVFLFDFV